MEVERSRYRGRHGLSRLSGDGNRGVAVATLAIGAPFLRQVLPMQQKQPRMRGPSCSCLQCGCHHAIVLQHPLDIRLSNLPSDSTNPDGAESSLPYINVAPFLTFLGSFTWSKTLLSPPLHFSLFLSLHTKPPPKSHHG